MPKTPLFSLEQIAAIEKLFGITRAPDVARVRDGYVKKGESVWWRHDGGPERVNSAEHWENLCGYPMAYQLAVPQVEVSYLD